MPHLGYAHSGRGVVSPGTTCSRARLGAHSQQQRRQCSQGLPALSSSGNGSSENRKASDADLTSMFQEAQQNIMRLNQSRLNAVAELKQARERIRELEGRLAEAAAGANLHAKSSGEHSRELQQQARQPSSSQAGQNPYQGTPTYSLRRSLDHSSQQSHLMAGPPQEPCVQPTESITIAYGTGWDKAYLHFRTQSGGWTQIPGLQMQPGTGNLQGSKVATIATTGRVEFVMNNGGNDWDTPDPYGGSKKHYVVDGPGTYYLKSGRLQQLG